ncbi:hypothetical protein [Pseudomonas paraeruginosa]|uniref:hypothetical protein n=1 Tax=Pseudomonas paraeruginosa TaxID=2994495 RepID=UPI000B1F4F4F|nr:hypothetical protein [Pseudomonas paraeruginosa]
MLNISRERVESGTACDVGLYVHDELVGNLQPGASLALNLQPGAQGQGLPGEDGHAVAAGVARAVRR